MRTTRAFRNVTLASVAALASMGLAACGDDGGGGSGDGAVTVWLSLNQPVIDGLQKVVDARAKEEGIKVKLEKVDSIDKVIKTRIEAGDPPDIALVPQPGVVSSIVELGAALPLDDVLDMDALEASMVPGTLDAGTVDGKLYGLLVSMNVKSLLFYPKKAFEAAGYELPTTLDELTALADKIRGEGKTPWCLTIESGDATGWVVTDWFEDLVMRFGGVDEYKEWTTGDLKFESDTVREAAKYFENVAFTKGNVAGGRTAIVATNFDQAAQPMFKSATPECWLLKQGSFFVGSDFLPAATLANVDTELGVTGFPPAEAGGDNPVLGGGDLAVLFSDSEDAAKAMNILAETAVGNEAAADSSFISPHKDFDVSLYATETTKQIAQVAYDSTTFLFDGSDAMPAVVGAGSFWKEMTAWVNGDRSLDEALKNIDASWPSS